MSASGDIELRRRSELLVSDKARERATAMLRRAFKRGRFDTEELERRIDAVLAARTREELRAVQRDLPEYRRWRARRRAALWWQAMLPPFLRRRR